MRHIVFLFTLFTVQSSPIILVPGMASSRLFVSVSPTAPLLIKGLCRHIPINSFFGAYLNLTMAKRSPLCLLPLLRCYYDISTHKTHNSEGVTVKAFGIGETSTIETISDSTDNAHFRTMVEYFVGKGYTRGVDIRGFPYDFRKGPSENEDQIQGLKILVEETFNSNNGSKVVIISHSYGTLFTLRLFHLMTPEWKENYIQKYISIAGPYAGSIAATIDVLFDDPMDPSQIEAYFDHELSKTFSSLYALFPNTDYLNGTDEFITTPTANYTLGEIDKFLLHLNKKEEAQMLKDQKSFHSVSPPNVPVHCIIGTGVPTINRIHYESILQIPHFPSSFEYEDGDKRVSFKSSSVCTNWQSQQEQSVDTLIRNNVNHSALLSDQHVLDYIFQNIS